MASFTLSRDQTALLVIDVQEKVFAAVDQAQAICENIQKIISGFQILRCPILVTEQYPAGLGETILPIKLALGDSYKPWIKTTFSCLDDTQFLRQIKSLPYKQWVLVGIEAHVCILQTAKSLLKNEKEVVVLNDAISSRSIYDYSTAIAEMRDAGARISSAETILFELLKDSKAPEFKQISQLIKTRNDCSGCCCG